ncbi:sensor histidine kinase [Variovorax sp. M-6]|uniref:sensor histidine kinase n=1 Tax=Variovorax sp. M-6 TaxID=3233041 RepID=UPI003F978935
MRGRLRRLWRSVGFRLASFFGFLVAVTMLVALGVVYLQTVGVMHARMERQISLVVQQLALRFDEGGSEAVAAEVGRALSDRHDADSEVYLLTDSDGRVIVGNLDKVPAAPPGAGAQRRVERDGETITARIVTHRFPDGGLLVVGHDLRDQQAVESMVGNASAAAGLVAMLLVIGGVFVFREQLERSVGEVRRTAARIAGGDLHERVALSGTDDEFELLSHEINGMLDRIESLMDGVRHVSDTMAHNLRTPLTRVLLRLRKAQQDGSSAQEQAIADAIGELEGLAVMAQKLLQIAEAEAGARRRHFEAIALDVLVEEVVELYDAAAQAQGLVLRREPLEPVRVLGDADLLVGVAGNLLDNAFKYAGAGALIRIGTCRVGDRAVLVVQDDGPGIAPADLERIGIRFVRLDTRLPGHGLGLASVRAVAALHGGSVRFADANPGLIVQVELPAR